MPVSSSTEHWIKPDALTINLNHFGDPDYLQVSVLAGAVVMAFKQDVIGYNAAHNYRTWPLEAANTYLETSSAYNVYARLTRSEVNARALVIYDPILRDIEGREITYNKNEETGEEKELLGEPNEDFYFIFLGQISSSIFSDGRTVLREWTSEYRSGSLETNEQQNDWMAILNKMFRPHYDDPLNPDLLTWIEAKAHMGVAGGLTSFIDNGSLKLPSIYDGLPIDYQTLYWEEIKEEVGTDEEGNPIYKTTKVLKGKGGGGSTTASLTIKYDGAGNAITALDYKNGVLTATKGQIFAAKSGLDAINTRVTTLENTINSGDSSNSSFDIEESGSGNAYTSYTYADGKLTLKKETSFATALQLSTLSGTVANKADKSSVYTKTEVDTKVNAKANTSDVYTKTEVDTKVNAKWTTDNSKISQWNAAYGWGNHADAGYVKSSSLTETLKSYVTVGGNATQTITGKKNFTGGLLVNGQELFFDKTERYWKMEGNLLVTGGITSYSSDGKATPFLLDVTEFDEITSNSTTQVYTANAVSLLKTKLDTVDEKADASDTRISKLKTALGNLSASNLSDLVTKLKTLNF